MKDILEDKCSLSTLILTLPTSSLWI
uniref:Uncharacterized protein n=1 Tax=Anguilla anguilla TaxID=7936 RepID=A0A0E9RZ98_ANGAN